VYAWLERLESARGNEVSAFIQTFDHVEGILTIFEPFWKLKLHHEVSTRNVNIFFVQIILLQLVPKLFEGFLLDPKTSSLCHDFNGFTFVHKDLLKFILFH